MSTSLPLPRTHPPARGDLRAAPGAAPVILLAEDHADSRAALRTLFDAMGYRVVEATDGAQAIQRAAETPPDLILMDVMMPRVDGIEAMRAIRRDPRFADVPIIAVTAMEGAREAVLEAGCDEVVPKPVDIRRLLARVQAHLAARRAAATD